LCIGCGGLLGVIGGLKANHRGVAPSHHLRHEEHQVNSCLRSGLRDGMRAAREARDAGFESVGVTGYRNLAIMAARIMDAGTAELAMREGLQYADAIEQSHCRQMMATTSALLTIIFAFFTMYYVLLEWPRIAGSNGAAWRSFQRRHS
jgi:hypothetical protein